MKWLHREKQIAPKESEKDKEVKIEVEKGFQYWVGIT